MIHGQGTSPTPAFIYEMGVEECTNLFMLRDFPNEFSSAVWNFVDSIIGSSIFPVKIGKIKKRNRLCVSSRERGREKLFLTLVINPFAGSVKILVFLGKKKWPQPCVISRNSSTSREWRNYILSWILTNFHELIRMLLKSMLGLISKL